MAIDKDMATSQLIIFSNPQNSNLILKLSKSQQDSHIVWPSMKRVRLTHGEKATASSLDMEKRMMKSSQGLLRDFKTFI